MCLRSNRELILRPWLNILLQPFIRATIRITKLPGKFTLSFRAFLRLRNCVTLGPLAFLKALTPLVATLNLLVRTRLQAIYPIMLN